MNPSLETPRKTSLFSDGPESARTHRTFAESPRVYDNSVAVLETGSVEALQA